MNNIIDFSNVEYLSKINITFKYRVKPKDEIDVETGEVIRTFYRPIIYIKNLSEDLEIMNRPFTFFCYKMYKDNSPTTQKKMLGYVTKFLNYIYFDCEAKIKKLNELTLEHGTEFLNKYALTHDKKETNTCLNCVKKFYIHFTSLKLIPNVDTPTLYESNPFNSYSGKEKSLNRNPLHDMDLPLVMFFMDLAKVHTPDIVFGVYLQVTGGLRISEVVSLTWNDIEPVGMNGENGFIVNLNDNKRMRSDLKNYHTNVGVKRPRNQMVLPFGNYQIDLYKKHRNKYYLKDQSGMDAVFVNKYDLPMTNKNYRDRFNKLKEIFLKSLLEKCNRDNDVNLLAYINKLSTENWSTHIFRGIYSNVVATYAKSLIEMMVMRGDKNLNSSLPYIQTSETTKEKITEHLSNVYEKFCSKEQFEKLYKMSKDLNNGKEK